MLEQNIDSTMEDKIMANSVMQECFPKVCAWCKEAYDFTSVERSSGICSSCFEKLVKGYFELLDVEQSTTFNKILNVIKSIE
ncbi:MAG: hypothetical protein IPK14_08300 [Blastocatellia bacterium]|nr:hypothetical protein [Blastocatellia bacterium]MBN8723810.1 hypothetical protein [Acidobacteriota bacterium]